MLSKLKNFAIILLMVAASSGCHAPQSQQAPYPLTQKNISSHDLPPMKIAFLLPLSGEHESIGKPMLDAAQLALYDANVPNLELVPIDTKSAPYEASQAAQAAVNKGAKLILGPVFSTSTKAAAAVTSSHGVNMVSLSNDASLAGMPGVFLLGFTPDQQVRRITQYASDQKIAHYAALVPNDAYGMMAGREFQQVISKNQRNMHKLDYYTPGQMGMESQVQSVVQALPADTQSALFIPEGGTQAKQIAALASQYNRGSLQLLGSGQWDDAGLYNVSALNGAWYAGSDPAMQQQFQQRFYDAYGYTPPRIASLAYDAVALATGVAVATGGDFSKASLTSERGFRGVNGVFRFRANGVSERGLAVLQIDNGIVRMIDPAPAAF